jgi:tetratricopeptide (TPR) repeat protein
MGRIDEAISKYEEAIEAKPGFGSEAKLSYTYAIIQDFTKAIYWADIYIKNAPSVGIKGRGYWVRGLLNYWRGNIKQSLIDLQKCVELSKSVGYEFAIAMTNWLKSWIFLDQGEFKKSEEFYDNYFNYLKKESPRYLPNYKADRAFFLGLTYLHKSQIDSSKQKLNEIDGLMPTLTPNGDVRAKRRYDLLYADILLTQDSLEKAIEKYKNISPMDIPFAFYWNFMAINFPYEKDGLAKAYLRKGELDKAITTYERMITLDKDSKNWFIIHPIYYYRLAKLYEKKGRRTEAIERYQKFLEIWIEADEDLPELIDARARLAKLME